MHQLCQRRHHQRLCFGVQRRRGLVEDQQPRVLQQRARNRNALALATRQFGAALAEQGVVARWQFGDEAVGVRGDRGGHDLFPAGVGPAIGDVVGHAQRQDERVLQHRRDLAAQAGQLRQAQVLAVDQHAPLPRVDKPQCQRGQRRLAGTAAADQGQRLAGPQFQRQAAQHRAARLVADGDVVEDEPPAAAAGAACRQGRRVRRVGDPVLRVEDLEDAVDTGLGSAQPAIGVEQ